MVAGIGYLPAPRLIIDILSNETTNFGPSDVAGRTKANARPRLRILTALSVGWSQYSRFPANAFWTLRQDDVNNLDLNPGLDHVRYWYVNPATGYGPVLVFNGRLGDPDQSGDDVVWTAWSYLAELALSRTGYNVMYKNKRIGSKIVTDEWSRDDASGKFKNYGARFRDHSLLKHIDTGTIQDPKMVNGTDDMRTDGQFGVIDVPRLLLFFDLTEMGRANTTNNVTMGISRSTAPAFFFKSNEGSFKAQRQLRYPGNIIDFRYIPGVLDVRNDLATIGTSKQSKPTEVKASITTGAYGVDTFGRRQDTFTIKTLAGFRHINEADVATGKVLNAQKAITEAAVKEASQLTRALQVDVLPWAFEPFDGWDIEDTVKVKLKEGRLNLSANYRIVGVRGMLDEAGYRQQLFLTQPIT